MTQAFSGAIDGIGGNKFSSAYFEAGNRAARIVAAAVVGGTTSVMSGGKFANGAITGAFSRAFNDEAHLNRFEKLEGYRKMISNGDITFDNDNPNLPHTNRSVSGVLADAVENTLDMTEQEININSSTGGKHGANSRHYLGKALDIDNINGVKVSFLAEKGLTTDIVILQKSLMAQPGVTAVFGSVYNMVKSGDNWIQAASHVELQKQHMNHIHVQVQ